jgi:hypothetical protein
MLTPAKIQRVAEETLDYWREEVTKPFIVELARGKEIGHKLADLVDEKTSALLTVNHITKHQHGSDGEKRSRSMGDLWLLDGDIYHPVNVKTGVVGAEGQPNLVSLKKVLSAILQHQIDSYYLLIVKMAIHGDATIVPGVFFIDMLDWLKYVTFDSGPGQMMLKANSFFSAYRPGVAPVRTIQEKVGDLLALYEDGERRLQVNRARDLEKYRRNVDVFLKSGDWTVTPATQRGLSLQ